MSIHQSILQLTSGYFQDSVNCITLLKESQKQLRDYKRAIWYGNVLFPLLTVRPQAIINLLYGWS